MLQFLDSFLKKAITLALLELSGMEYYSYQLFSDVVTIEII